MKAEAKLKWYINGNAKKAECKKAESKLMAVAE